MSATHRPHGAALCERRAHLEPAPGSASEARRLLRDALLEVEREVWLDSAELAISEVVTNASLHAHTPIDVTVEIFADRACVQVRDYNPTYPVPRLYDADATTGRGMALVAALALDCGVDLLGEDGKVVWFSIGDSVAGHTDDLLALWDVDEWGGTTVGEAPNVVLEGLPVALWWSVREHHDAILRELAIYASDRPELTPDLAAADRARTTISNALILLLQEQEANGTRTAASRDPVALAPPELVDLALYVAPDVQPMFNTLQDVLDGAEQLAVTGELFVRPALPEIIAVRDWACEQVVAQLAGVPAVPWSGTAQPRFETEVHDRRDAPQWDASIVERSHAFVAAADEANRLIAVSRSLAALVGWEVRELVGRRVITLIPMRYREAHVAGFSRHLSTGESHILGVDVELPLLCADGSELTCGVRLEAVSTPTGSVYLAHITP